MSKHYQFERGLGKKEIGIAPTRCVGCQRSDVALTKITIKGKKVYVCEKCRRG